MLAIREAGCSLFVDPLMRRKPILAMGGTAIGTGVHDDDEDLWPARRSRPADN